MKKLLTVTLSALLALSLLSGCGSSNTESTTLKVGASITPHAEILEQCKPILEEQGIELEIVEYTDYVQPNTSTGSMRTTAPIW